MNQYPVQTLVQLSVAFTAVDTGSPVDPTAVALTINLPDGTTIAPESGIVQDGTGLYHYDQIVTQLGIWRYRWQGTGAVIAATPLSLFRGI